MTYEEAKELFNSNNYQEIICHSKLCDYSNTGCGDCKLTHMRYRINEALEKQIPKKPYKDEYGCLRSKCCGYAVEHEAHAKGGLMGVYIDLYCTNCGQAIDFKED